MAERKNSTYGKKEIAKYADPEGWEIWKAPDGYETLYQTFPEFTCLCPRSSYPDFAKVHLVTVPDKKVLELKALKMWLNSFRDKRVSHETATAQILDTLVERLDLNYGFVLMEYTPRGNLTTFPMREYAKEGVLPTDSSLHRQFSLAHTIRDQIVNTVVGRQLAHG